MNCKNKNVVDIYSDLYYHLFLSFEWILHHGVEGGKVMFIIRWKGGSEVAHCIPRHVRRDLYAENIV